jgi:hypothetical protein
MNHKTSTGIIVALLFAVMVFTSCERKNRSSKVRSIGNTSEVLVVVENEGQWESKIGQVIRDNLEAEQHGLNQSESIFKLAHLQKQSFSEMFQKHRNLIIVEMDKKAKKPKVDFFEDYWSKPQVIFKITARDTDEFVTTFENHVHEFIEKFEQAERDRILTVFRTSASNKVTDQVATDLGLKMTIPREFYMAKAEPDFFWIRKEVEAFSQGLVIFSEPYIDTAQFSKASIIARTNRFMQQYIPGPTEGSYMTTSEKFVIPEAEVIDDYFTDYAVEIRGLWRVEGDFMSGPFVSYTFTDPRNGHIVTQMGYVFRPNKEKRDLLRQLEAILYSTRFYPG